MGIGGWRSLFSHFACGIHAGQRRIGDGDGKGHYDGDPVRGFRNGRGDDKLKRQRENFIWK